MGTSRGDSQSESSDVGPPEVSPASPRPASPENPGLFEQARLLSWSAPVPRLLRVRRRGEAGSVGDIERAVADALEPLRGRIEPGCSIAVTAGSRGIAELGTIYRAVGAVLSGLGAHPFVVAAMGSHGGGSPAGRLAVLESLGLHEELIGMPIVSTDDLVEIGVLDHGPVRMARLAVEADLILAVNRVKPHTDFHGSIESGLAKVLAVGLGNQAGAALIHEGGPEQMSSTVVEVSDVLVSTGKVVGGLAILENERHQVARFAFVEAEEIGHAGESALLVEAGAMMGSLPFDEIDVLVVSEIGKEISGAGIDPNVVGRMRIEGMAEPAAPRIAVLVALGLSEMTAGNGVGLGLADFTTLRAIGQLDFAKTYLNALTAGRGGIRRAALPIVMPTDRDAICVSLATCGERRADRRRLVCIRNTIVLWELLVSESLRADVESDPGLEIVGELGPMAFDADGRFVSWEADAS
ncbi:MAG: DUF2088 domain-containing protein [Acidimicrobiales bacterium]|jgi:hypothetical protein